MLRRLVNAAPTCSSPTRTAERPRRGQCSSTKYRLRPVAPRAALQRGSICGGTLRGPHVHAEHRLRERHLQRRHVRMRLGRELRRLADVPGRGIGDMRSRVHPEQRLRAGPLHQRPVRRLQQHVAVPRQRVLVDVRRHSRAATTGTAPRSARASSRRRAARARFRRRRRRSSSCSST